MLVQSHAWVTRVHRPTRPVHLCLTYPDIPHCPLSHDAASALPDDCHSFLNLGDPASLRCHDITDQDLPIHPSPSATCLPTHRRTRQARGQTRYGRYAFSSHQWQPTSWLTRHCRTALMLVVQSQGWASVACSSSVRSMAYTSYPKGMEPWIKTAGSKS